MLRRATFDTKDVLEISNCEGLVDLEAYLIMNLMVNVMPPMTSDFFLYASYLQDSSIKSRKWRYTVFVK